MQNNISSCDVVLVGKTPCVLFPGEASPQDLVQDDLRIGGWGGPRDSIPSHSPAVTPSPFPPPNPCPPSSPLHRAFITSRRSQPTVVKRRCQIGSAHRWTSRFTRFKSAPRRPLPSLHLQCDEIAEDSIDQLSLNIFERHPSS